MYICIYVYIYTYSHVCIIDSIPYSHPLPIPSAPREVGLAHSAAAAHLSDDPHEQVPWAKAAGSFQDDGAEVDAMDGSMASMPIPR